MYRMPKVTKDLTQVQKDALKKAKINKLLKSCMKHSGDKVIKRAKLVEDEEKLAKRKEEDLFLMQ